MNIAPRHWKKLLARMKSETSQLYMACAASGWVNNGNKPVFEDLPKLQALVVCDAIAIYGMRAKRAEHGGWTFKGRRFDPQPCEHGSNIGYTFSSSPTMRTAFVRISTGTPWPGYFASSASSGGLTASTTRVKPSR
jgi:hypothetical protein